MGEKMMRISVSGMVPREVFEWALNQSTLQRVDYGQVLLNSAVSAVRNPEPAARIYPGRQTEIPGCLEMVRP